MAMQYLMQGASEGERCLYITLSEAQEELTAGARSHGWSDLPIILLIPGTLSFASWSRDSYDEADLSFFTTLAHYVTTAYVKLQLVPRLKESDQRKDEFLATLAHELRNPLAPISNGFQVICIAGGDRKLIDKILDTMERQLSHMVRLIDDLLDLSDMKCTPSMTDKPPSNLPKRFGPTWCYSISDSPS